MRAQPHPHRTRRRRPERTSVAALLGLSLTVGVLVPGAAAAQGHVAGGAKPAASGTTAGIEEPSGTPTLSPSTGTFVDGTLAVASGPVQPGDSVQSLAVDGQELDAQAAPATAHLLFDVGSNSADVRFGNYLLVNGERVDIERTIVSERAALDVPADLLVQGENTVEFVTGPMASDCGDNFDDFDVTDVSLELLGDVADGSGNDFTYQLGDGSCGSNTVRTLTAELTFDLAPEPAATTGLTAELDTTTLENGAHSLVATTAAGLAATSAITVNNSAPGAPAILPVDGALLDGEQTFLATPPAGGERPTGIELDGEALDTTETLGAGSSVFVFTVGSNSIEARYVNHLLVNGQRIDLVDRDYVSETVRIDVPNGYLQAGRNTVRFVAGTFPGSCGDNRDDFSISGLGLEVTDGSATPVGVAPSYAIGDGSCGSDATKPREVDLVFDVVRAADAPASGLRAEVDTAQLADGEHTVTSATAGGLKASRTVTTDNTGPAVVSSTPQAGQTLRSAAPLAVEIDDASGVLDGPHVTLDGDVLEPGTPVGPGLEPGEHALVVTATDVLGNESTHEVAFTSAGVPDVPTDLVPADGTRDVDGSVDLGARVAVPGGGDATATFARVETTVPVVAAQGSVAEAPTTLHVEGEAAAPVDDLLPADDATLDSPATGDVAFQRFEIPAEGDVAGRTVRWEGVIDPQRVATLNVWDGEAWVPVASARGEVEGSTTLTGTLAPEHAHDGVVHVLVTGTDPFADSIADGVAGQQPTSFADPDDYDFSMVHFTDTQYLSEGAVEQETPEERAVWAQAYTDSAQWIVDNADERKIKYVAHTGDVNENYTRVPADEVMAAQIRGEYEFSSATQKILDDANIPNGVLAGNHDNLTGMDNGPGALFNEFYGPERYEALSEGWEDASYGGPWREDDNQNHYDLFTAGGLDFVAVYLSYGVTTEEADWADDLLKQYPDRNAILLTHDYLVPSTSPDGRGSEIATPDGRLLHARVVEPNDNIFLILSGHRHGVGINVRQDDGEDSGIVELVADYQAYLVTAEEAGLTEAGGYTPEQGLRFGASFLRLLQFDVDRSEMIVDTYSPWLDDFAATEYDADGRYDGREDDFTVPVDLTSRTTTLSTDSVSVLTTGEEIGVATVASGEVANVTWGDLEPVAVHTWTVTATSADGGVTTAPVQSFVTAATGGELVVTTTARTQCMAGKAHVAVRATNDDTVPVDVTLETPYGTRTVEGVEPGTSAYQAFAVRSAAVEAGVAHVSATGDGRSAEQDVAYDAIDCG
ncbi:metallophosphoesterase [Cellulosimicrobium terreum]|nr:metallophosphoesterase [Cellulosimicrobium terreum]